MYDDDDDEGGRFSKRRREPEPAKRGIFARLGLWLVGAVVSGVVPLFVALWALSAARDYAPMLARPTTAAALGSAAVVALTFSVALFVEFYLYWKMGPSAGRDEAAPVRGRLQFLITYVLVPLVPGVVAGYLTLAPAAGPWRPFDWINPSSGAKVERQVAQAVRAAAVSETRVAGLGALAQFGSADALDELTRLAAEDPQLLNDPPSFDALAGALASFGAQAEPVLQRLWKDAGRTAAGGAASGGKTAADVALAAYARMDAIADTASALAIARDAAAAPAAGPERLSAAIALVAKFGSRSDVGWLASFLAERPEPVKQAALDGLRHLDARLRKQDAPLPMNGPSAGR